MIKFHKSLVTACLLLSFFGLSQSNVSAQSSRENMQLAKKSSDKSETEEKTVLRENTDSAEITIKSSGSTNVNVSRVGIQTAQTIPLSLNDAIRKTLENNNDIEIARDEVRFQETQLRSLRGTYDAVFSLTPRYSRSSSTGAEGSNDFRVDVGVNKLIERGGGSFNTFFNTNQTGRNSQNNTSFNQTAGLGANSNSTFFSNLGVTYTQPLFRNFRVDNTRRQIRIQRRRLQQSDAEFRRQTIEVIAQVQRAYWDLVFALRNQQNQVANVNLARENLRQVEIRIEAGVAAPLARAEVATELANREGELLLATQQVSITENNLKTLVLRDVASPEWTASFVPTDRPVYSDEPIQIDDAVKDAIDNRPELQRLRLQREITTIDIDYFRNQTKPRIDLVSSFSLGGISLGNQANGNFNIPQFTGNEEILRQRLNTLLPPESQIPNPLIQISGLPDFYNGGTVRSLQNLFRTDAPNYSVGVTIEIPFRNTTAKANLAGARIQQEQNETQARRQEQIIVAEVRNAVQAVETARLRVLTARRARENAEIQLEGERKLFEVGRSTTFLLFQRENSLTNVRNAEIRAETDYNKALADLQRVTSSTFRLNNIVIESPVNGMDDKD